MKKHVMPLTYAPKIEPVRSGRCNQTIRKGRRFAVGDEILLHDWIGKPYRTKWGWRMRVKVTQVINILVSGDSVVFIDQPVRYKCAWNDEPVNDLAREDYIDPPTGEALRGVLFGLNGAPDGVGEYQVIRWSIMED